MANLIGETTGILVRIHGDVTSFKKSIGAAQGIAGKFKAGMRASLLPAAGILAAVGGASVVMAKNFNSSMQEIVGLVGVSQKQVNAWRDDILQMATELPQSPKELADALYYVTSAGFRGEDALNVLRASAKAAASGLGETMDVANAVTSAVNAYGIANLKAGDATDILTATVREGKAAASDIAPVLGTLLPLSSELGVSFNDVGAAMAAMTRTGNNAAQASTQIRAILSGLLKPTKQGKKALEGVDLTYKKIRDTIKKKGLFKALMEVKSAFNGNEQALANVFPNVRAFRGVLALTGNSAEKNAEIFKSLADATGSADKAFKVASEEAGFKFNAALSSLQATAIQLGDVILPPLADIIDKVGKFLAKHRTAAVAMGVALLGIAAAVVLINAAMAVFAALTSPIGLVVLAIAAVVAGIVLLWKKSETFRRIVTAVWDAIKKAVSAVVDWITGSAVPWLQDAWDAISGAVEAAWGVIQNVVDWIADAIGWVGDRFDDFRNAVSTAWEWIKGAFQAAWDFVSPVFDAIGAVVQKAVEWFQFLAQFVKLYFQIIGVVIAAAWFVIKKVFGWIGDIIGWLGDKFRWLYDHVIKPVWDWIAEKISDAWGWIQDRLKEGWDWIDRNVFQKVRDGMDKVKEGFSIAADFIGDAWGKIKRFAAKPIKFVIDTVLNKGIIHGFNWISEKVGGPHVDYIKLPAGLRNYASGGVLPGYSPRRDIHRFVSPTGGILDLSGGEAFMVPEFVRMVGGPRGIAALNSAARRQSFASGGILGTLQSAANWIGSKAAGAWDWVTDKASAIYKAVTNPVKYLTDKIGSIPGIGLVKDVAVAAKDKLISTVVDKVKALWSRFRQAYDLAHVIPAGPEGWLAMRAWVERALPGSTVSSGYRPGAMTAVGTISRHAMGRAVDIVPGSTSTFNKIVRTFGLKNIRELIYSPMGNQNILNGHRYLPASVTLRDHWNHIHWSMARGGVWPGVRSYDRGGYLPPGVSMAYNGTGRPEKVGGGDTYYITAQLDPTKVRTIDDLVQWVEGLDVRVPMVQGVNT